MKSRCKKKKIKKTQKIIKGGTNADAQAKEVQIKAAEAQIEAQALMTETLETGIKTMKELKCYSSPISCLLPRLVNQIIFSCKMINSVLLETGMYTKNVFTYGLESSLYYIIGDVCMDIFKETTCKIKLNKLLNMSFTKNKKKENEKKENVQLGGSINLPPELQNVLKNSQPESQPEVQEEVQPENINAIIIAHNMISHKFAYPDVAKQYILEQLKLVDEYELYEYLKYIKILEDLYGEEIDKEKKEEEEDFVLPLFQNTTSLNNISFAEWKECSDYHRSETLNETMSEKCDLKCDLCRMKNQHLILVNKSIDYHPNFITYFRNLNIVIKQYYNIKNSDKLVESLTKNIDSIDKFIEKIKNENIYNYFEKGIEYEPIEEEVSVQLKNVCKVNKELSIHQTLFESLLGKLSNKDILKKFIEYIKE